MCPRLGIQPATSWFTGWRSIHWATPARAQNSFWTHWFWCLLVLWLFFVSPLQAKHFPLRMFFHPWKKKKSCLGRDSVNREGGAWGPCGLGQKLLNTQCSVGRCAPESPTMKWANTLEKSFKKCKEAKCSLSQQCQLVYCTDGFLEHPPSGGSLYYKGPTLQKIILGFLPGGVPPCMWSPLVTSWIYHQFSISKLH